MILIEDESKNKFNPELSVFDTLNAKKREVALSFNDCHYFELI